MPAPRQERCQYVPALDRDPEPVHHLIGHPDRRPVGSGNLFTRKELVTG
jgi:hypothetical protein